MQPSAHHKPASPFDRDVDREEGRAEAADLGAVLADDDLAPPTQPSLLGEVSFVDAHVRVERTVELRRGGAVVVNVPPLPMVLRGQLAEHIDARVERELAARGASTTELVETAPATEFGEARLSDQLARARAVGASGIAVLLGTLAGSAAPALDPDDSATLRLLTRRTASAPLVLLLDAADASLGGYAAPLPLEVLLSMPVIRPPASLRAAPTLDDEDEASEEARFHAFDSTPPESEPSEDSLIPSRILSAAELEGPVAPEVVDSFADDVSTEAAAPLPTTEDGDGSFDGSLELVQTNVDAPVAPTAAAPTATVDASLGQDEPASRAERSPAKRRAARMSAPDAHRSATASIPTSGPSDYWRSWALSLGAARGPQPLAALERLFAESYVPLANAIAAGVDDPRAVRAYDEFRRGFDRTYTDAFATFGVTGRRPRLVMDAYELAAKQARLHNARSTHILVVDSMRYDIGMRVRDLLSERAAGVASLTSETMLWSALPSTTFRQLETLARGMDALRAPMTEEPNESLRGRVAENVRRLRVGSRELFKLDIVPAMLASIPDFGLRGTAEQVVGSFETIAEATAESLARHLAALPPRTLLYVVGDHGFCVDRRGNIAQGGASPEEVLVPALAYLVGELH